LVVGQVTYKAQYNFTAEQSRMKFLIFCSVLALTQARPQEFLDSSEVELIDPVVNDGDEAEGGDPIVLVIRGGSLPSLGNFPFPGGFPFRNTPRVPSRPSFFGSDGGIDFSGLNVPGGLRGIFGGNRRGEQDQDQEVNGDRPCGPICTMFRVLGGIQGEIDDIHREMHDGAGGAGGEEDEGFSGFPSFFGGENPFDLNNSTYEEKELEDGSIVRINRTVVSDTDDNGNQFFFHSSVIHNFGDDGVEVDVELQPEQQDEVVGVVEEQLPEVIEVVEEQLPEAVEDLLPEGDDAINEISDEFPTADVEGVDDGLAE